MVTNSKIKNLKTASDCINTLFFYVRRVSNNAELCTVESVGHNGSYCIVIYMSCLIVGNKNITSSDFNNDNRKYFNFVLEFINPILRKYNINTIRFTCLGSNSKPYYKDFMYIAEHWSQFGGGKTTLW